jgi:hypothetical protein
MSHPICSDGHVCQQPSGRTCVEKGCLEPAGTFWGPMWCPEHDAQRLDRITASLSQISASLKGAA